MTTDTMRSWSRVFKAHVERQDQLAREAAYDEAYDDYLERPAAPFNVSVKTRWYEEMSELDWAGWVPET